MDNRHLRKLLVVGAHVALYRMKKGTADTPLANWARCLLSKKPFKLVAVALANKIARIAWAMMARNTNFQSDLAPEYADPFPT
jgi:transposase